MNLLYESIKGTILNPFSSTHFSETPRTAHVSTDDGSCFVAAVLRRLDQGHQWDAQRSNEWLNGLHLLNSLNLCIAQTHYSTLPLANCLKPLSVADKDVEAVAALYADDCEWVWHSSGKTMGRRPLCL